VTSKELSTSTSLFIIAATCPPECYPCTACSAEV